jgi:hypothetical protein
VVRTQLDGCEYAEGAAHEEGIVRGRDVRRSRERGEVRGHERVHGTVLTDGRVYREAREAREDFERGGERGEAHVRELGLVLRDSEVLQRGAASLRSGGQQDESTAEIRNETQEAEALQRS